MRVGLLDEPTHGVDVGAKAEMTDIIRDLAAEGVCFVIAAAEFGDLLGLATRILTLHKGTLIGEHDPTRRDGVEHLLLEATTGRPDPGGASVRSSRVDPMADLTAEVVL